MILYYTIIKLFDSIPKKFKFSVGRFWAQQEVRGFPIFHEAGWDFFSHFFLWNQAIQLTITNLKTNIRATCMQMMGIVALVVCELRPVELEKKHFSCFFLFCIRSFFYKQASNMFCLLFWGLGWGDDNAITTSLAQIRLPFE